MNNRDPRRVTLSQQLTMESDFDSPNIRSLPNRNPAGHWDGTAPSLRASSGRTLLDIIQQDDNWKPVKDRLRLQRVGAAFSGVPSPRDEAPVPAMRYPIDTAPTNSLTNGVGGSRTAFGGAQSLRRNTTLARSMTRSVTVQPASVLSMGNNPGVGEIVITEITDVTDDPDEMEQDDGKEEEQAKEDASGGGMSLMALLEQTDTQWGDGGPEEIDELNFQDNDEMEIDDDEKADADGIYHVCCVCMVRHKGAAFIPCGHTFCRLCSRELWVSRGNCPLCNGFIQEILDIF